MDCGSRRIIAPGRRGRLRAIRQKLASTPTPGAFSTIRRSTRPIVSSTVVMIPVPALYYWALRPSGCSAIREALASIADSLLIAHPFTLSLVLTFSAVLHLSLVEAVEALVAEQRLSLPFEPGICTARRWSGRVPAKKQSPAFGRA